MLRRAWPATVVGLVAVLVAWGVLAGGAFPVQPDPGGSGGATLAGPVQGFAVGTGDGGGDSDSGADPPNVTTVGTYSGGADDSARDLVETGDGGFLLAGTSQRGDTRGRDAWLVRTDGNGDPVWEVAIGGPYDDVANAVARTADDGYVVVGRQRRAPRGENESFLWVTKVDDAGDVRWNVTLAPGSQSATGEAVLPVGDGRYLVAGREHFAGDGEDAVLLEVAAEDGAASVDWRERYGGDGDDAALALADANQTGAVFAGYTGGAGGFGAAGDAWLVRVGPRGGLEWNRTLGNGTATAVVPTADGYGVAGEGGRFGIGGERTPWLARTDRSGREQWSRAFEQTSCYGTDLVRAGDGFTLAGSTCSDVVDPTVFNAWTLRTDGTGSPTWNVTYGVDQGSAVRALVETGGGGYSLAGGRAEGDAGDFWLVTVAGRPPAERNRPPVAAFRHTPFLPRADHEISFDGRLSFDPDGDIVTVAWDLDGDGSSDATGETVTHTFETTGLHPVTVRVADDDGVNRTATRLVPVGVSPPTECRDADGDGNGDDDGDGLCDHWETEGIDVDDDGTVDLALHEAPYDADPERKDVFVEIDYMDCAEGGCAGGDTHDHEPTPEALAAVRRAFADAPVENPDGSTGIILHTMTDEALPEVTPLRFGDGAVVAGPDGTFDELKHGDTAADCDGHFGTAANRSGEDCAAALHARQLVFHYAVYGHSHAHGLASSGRAEIHGDDFVVTLRRPEYRNHAETLARRWGTSAEREWRTLEAGAFMHELGHNLDLEHGGDDATPNRKPNYRSVMNYNYQWNNSGDAVHVPGVARGTLVRTNRTLDYSSGTAPTLREASLDEAGALADLQRGWRIRYGPTVDTSNPGGGHVAPATGDGGDVDWNVDGNITAGVSVDLNGDGSSSGVLSDHDDWDDIRYNFRDGGDVSLGDHRSARTLPPEQDGRDYLNGGLGSPDADGDGVPNVEDDTPLDPAAGTAETPTEGTAGQWWVVAGVLVAGLAVLLGLGLVLRRR